LFYIWLYLYPSFLVLHENGWAYASIWSNKPFLPFRPSVTFPFIYPSSLNATCFLHLLPTDCSTCLSIFRHISLFVCLLTCHSVQFLPFSDWKPVVGFSRKFSYFLSVFLLTHNCICPSFNLFSPIIL